MDKEKKTWKKDESDYDYGYGSSGACDEINDDDGVH